jgi:hypothetical protein
MKCTYNAFCYSLHSLLFSLEFTLLLKTCNTCSSIKFRDHAPQSRKITSKMTTIYCDMTPCSQTSGLSAAPWIRPLLGNGLVPIPVKMNTQESRDCWKQFSIQSVLKLYREDEAGKGHWSQLQDSQNHETVKYGHEFQGTWNI